MLLSKSSYNQLNARRMNKLKIVKQVRLAPFSTREENVIVVLITEIYTRTLLTRKKMPCSPTSYLRISKLLCWSTQKVEDLIMAISIYYFPEPSHLT